MNEETVRRFYRGAVAVFVVLAVLAAFCGQVIAAAPQSRLARAVYITMTKGCACTVQRCQAGDGVVAQVFSGARQRLLTRVDATNKDAASSYIKNYGVVVLPSLLILDSQGKLLWSAQGEMNRDATGPVRRIGEQRMKIEFLGPGCPRCHQTYDIVKQAAAELGLADEVAYVTDLKEIMKAGIFSTPAVVVDGDVKTSGKVPTVAEAKKMLQEAAC